MLSSLLVALREGVEAALVVGIVLVYLNRTGRRALTHYVWGGVLAAMAATSHYSTLATFVAIVFAAYNAVVRSRFRGPALLSLALAAVAVMAIFPDSSPPALPQESSRRQSLRSSISSTEAPR